jgi:hypothetical protein
VIETIERIRSIGADVLVERGDIAQAHTAERLLATATATGFPRLNPENADPTYSKLGSPNNWILTSTVNEPTGISWRMSASRQKRPSPARRLLILSIGQVLRRSYSLRGKTGNQFLGAAGNESRAGPRRASQGIDTSSVPAGASKRGLILVAAQARLISRQMTGRAARPAFANAIWR